jgi:hypothetical protein
MSLVPPKVKNASKEYLFTSLDEEVTLTCDVDCSNPPPTNYSWLNEKNALIANTKTDTYKLKLNAQSKDDVIMIRCVVENGIKTADTSETETKFTIKYNNKGGKYFLFSFL